MTRAERESLNQRIVQFYVGAAKRKKLLGVYCKKKGSVMNPKRSRSQLNTAEGFYRWA